MIALHRVVRLLLFALLVLQLAAASRCVLAQSQQAALAPGVSAVQQASIDTSLAIGEQYSVTAERGQVAEHYSGTLILANNDWIVLRSVSEARNDDAASEVGLLPFLQRQVNKVDVVRVTERIWIPRTAAAKCERRSSAAPAEASKLVQAAALEAPREATPKAGSICSVDVVDGGKLGSRDGKLAKLSNGKLNLARQHTETQRRPSRTLPFGDLFAEERTVTKTTIEMHSLDKVLAVRVPFESPGAVK